MKIFVTGGAGFVGRHLSATLRARGHTGLDAIPPDGPGGLELTDASSVRAAIQRSEADAVIHLAAMSSVAESHREPGKTFAVNALGTMNLCAALREVAPGARLLLVSSGEVYGRLEPGTLAVESCEPMPQSPYAASKLAAEIVALQFRRSYGTDVVIARPYNHLGRGQAAHFVVPSFAAQIGAIRRGKASPVLKTGDLTAVRDFLHVTDVVAAYELLLSRGASGETYNVASGVGRSIRTLLDEMLSLASVTARIEVDPSRVRPIEIPEMVGDSAKLRALGWTPKSSVEKALRDVLEEHAE
jgi:GDP-4-dehydro-6-deoxy-D-mannose reductase